jgi:predicted extracellular nuclease
VATGDRVRLCGAVSEFFGSTQITLQADTLAVLASSSALPQPVDLSGVPNAELERYEGMLVSFTEPMVVAEFFNLDRFGEMTLFPRTPPATPTQQEGYCAIAPTDLASRAAYVAQALEAYASSAIVIDDANSAQNPLPVPFLSSADDGDDQTVRRGDTLPAGFTGVLTYAFSQWRVYPLNVAALSFERTNPRPLAVPGVAVDGSPNVRVVSFNTLNFFSTIDASGAGSGPNDLEPRGADNEEEKGRQLSKLVAALDQLDADVFALQEMENGPACSEPGAKGITAAVDELKEALNALNTLRQYGTVLGEIDSRFVGTDAIRVDFLFKVSTVAAEGPASVIDSAGSPFETTQLLGRPSLAQAFVHLATRAKFMVVNNHFKSKGSACAGDPPTPNLGQGNCNAVRVSQARAVLEAVSELSVAHGTEDVLFVGDFNSYLCARSRHARARATRAHAPAPGRTHVCGSARRFAPPRRARGRRCEDPIRTLENSGLVNLEAAYRKDVDPNDYSSALYSYVFDGQHGNLDGAFASLSLSTKVTGASIWHINADEPDVKDYNTDFGRGANDVAQGVDGKTPYFAPNGFRASDHDPLVVGMRFSLSPSACADAKPAAWCVDQRMRCDRGWIWRSCTATCVAAYFDGCAPAAHQEQSAWCENAKSKNWCQARLHLCEVPKIGRLFCREECAVDFASRCPAVRA